MIEMCLAVALHHALSGDVLTQTEERLGMDTCDMCLEVSAQWRYGAPDFYYWDEETQASQPYWRKELVCIPEYLLEGDNA